MKMCSSCKIDKPVTEFHKANNTRDGLHSYCKDCNRRKSREWVAKNRDRHNTRRLDTSYGMPKGWLAEQRQKQGNLCAICGRQEKLAVDHNHLCCPQSYGTCGSCTRALLCYDCNRGLGAFRDSPDLLKAAADYLRLHG